MLTTSPEFKANAHRALADAGLRKALAFSKPQSMARRTAAVANLPADRMFAERRDILTEACGRLRQRFLAADVRVTGANFLIAKPGSSVIATNEGNGTLTQTLPRVHIVLASIEKVVATLEDTTSLLRVLARSATRQDFSVYTTFSTGGRRPGDLDGLEKHHVVLVDAGRSAERMAHSPRHLTPARSQVARPEQIALLLRNIEKKFGTVTRVPGSDEVPETVAEYLAAQNLPSSLVMAPPHPGLRALSWSARSLLVIREGRAEGTDLVSLRHGPHRLHVVLIEDDPDARAA